MRSLGEALIQYDLCPYETGKLGQRGPHGECPVKTAEIRGHISKSRDTNDCQQAKRN